MIFGNWPFFPHTDFTHINLDWILDCLKALTGGTTGTYLRKKSDTDFDFEWATGGGGGGTSDYNDLSNKPQINGNTLSGNKTSSQLGITASALGAYVKPSGGIPKTDLAAAVQTSLGKADTALQSAPVTSVDGKTGTVSILPSGGTTGQVLAKSANGDYLVHWINQSGGGGGGSVDSVNGQTGTVVLGAADVGAMAAVTGTTAGQVLTWTGSAWAAQALPVYSGGVG